MAHETATTQADQKEKSLPPSSPPSKRNWRLWLVCILLAAVGILAPETYRVFFGSNFHTVVDGRLYRAAQPSGPALEDYIRSLGIRTVINLRGPNPGEDWFDAEMQAADKCGVKFVSVNMSASDKPQEQELRNLLTAFESPECPEPILVHCNSGSDRSGFASACFLLLKTNATLEEARAQLGLRYGHFSWGKAGCQGQVLDSYRDWLTARGVVHEPERFRQWATKDYFKDDWPKGAAVVGR